MQPGLSSSVGMILCIWGDICNKHTHGKGGSKQPTCHAAPQPIPQACLTIPFPPGAPPPVEAGELDGRAASSIVSLGPTSSLLAPAEAKGSSLRALPLPSSGMTASAEAKMRKDRSGQGESIGRGPMPVHPTESLRSHLHAKLSAMLSCPFIVAQKVEEHLHVDIGYPPFCTPACSPLRG